MGMPVAHHSVGEPIPEAEHAISVSLPTWNSNVAYEEGEEWVVKKMRNGYPRFFINTNIVTLQQSLLLIYGTYQEDVLLFPCTSIARRCAEFVEKLSSNFNESDYLRCRILELLPLSTVKDDELLEEQFRNGLSAVFFDKRDLSIARKFWQHTGDGISSRRAVFFQKLFEENRLVPRKSEANSSERATPSKGPKRYRGTSDAADEDATALHRAGVNDNVQIVYKDSMKFVEERFGRNLDPLLTAEAKLAIKRRIAGLISEDQPVDCHTLPLHYEQSHSMRGISPDHVYLFPCGMSAIYNTHRMLRLLRGEMKSIMFGFPYTDTLKVLEKFGSGALFYGNGSASDLDDLEERCKLGERFLALFCEFPGNPLLRSPDLRRIRTLADRYDFMVVIDETIGNFLNVNILPMADVVVSSLTKIFSGDSNVMGGSSVLNPAGRYFQDIFDITQEQYVDNLWPEDAIFLERNSRDFVNRNRRINSNAEALAELLHASSKIKCLNYPKFSDTRSFFDDFRNPSGGYSGLLSVTFHSGGDAVKFYDALATQKGPSLGTNFTLSSPFVILAHYHELDWVKQFGVEPDLVRVSVGLEPSDRLIRVFQSALDAISNQ